MIEALLYSALSSLFSGRVFPDIAPQGTAHPFLTYQQVGGKPSNSFCGNTTAQNVWIQFNVWCDAAAGGRTQATTLMRSVELIATSSPLLGVSLGSAVSLYDDLTRTYGSRQDISFWS